MGYERNRSGLPPDRMLREKTLGHCPRLLILGSEWELLVMSKDDKARPFSMSSEVLDLETDKRVLSHPFDFLTQCGKAVEKITGQVDMNGNDVRLIVVGAGQPGETGLGKHCAALLLRHFLDDHGEPHTIK